MTDNEIIKALECCTRGRMIGGKIPCADCPYDKCNVEYNIACSPLLMKDSLDLINRLQAEIEALIAGQETLQKHIASQRAEIERLQNESIGNCELAMSMRSDHSIDVDCNYCVEQAKAEAIKEFAERLEPLKKFRSCMTTSEYELSVTMREVDAVKKELMKELVGDNKERKEDEGK